MCWNTAIPLWCCIKIFFEKPNYFVLIIIIKQSCLQNLVKFQLVNNFNIFRNFRNNRCSDLHRIFFSSIWRERIHRMGNRIYLLLGVSRGLVPCKWLPRFSCSQDVWQGRGSFIIKENIFINSLTITTAALKCVVKSLFWIFFLILILVMLLLFHWLVKY